jgi:hypothetical protein
VRVLDPITSKTYDASELLCQKIGCGRVAEFATITDTRHPTDYGVSCSDHLGELLGTIVTGVKWEELTWTVIPIVEATEEDEERFGAAA